MSRYLAGAVIVGSGGLYSSVALALSCAAYSVGLVSPRIDRLPDQHSRAPLNAHVLVQVHSVGRAPPSNLTLWLEEQGGSRVRIHRTDAGAGTAWTIRLKPRLELRSRTAYEVYWQREDAKRVLAGRFTTGDARDESPPQIELHRGRLVDALVYDGWNPEKRRARYLSIELGRPRDSGSPNAVAYAVWTTAQATVDFTQPPQLYVQSQQYVDQDHGLVSQLILGNTASACPATNFDVPERRGKLRVGVRAVDQAGNLSPPAIVVIDLNEKTDP